MQESKLLTFNILNNLGFSLFQNLGLLAFLGILVPMWYLDKPLQIEDSFTLLALIYYMFFSVNSLAIFAFGNAGKFSTTVERVSQVLSLEEVLDRASDQVARDAD